ncbi:hypothetical protein GCM10010401_15820 [Rarobacter faecitabidus]|uniref:Aromatic ring-opening dioxygenase LigA n=1 Tax=Rarobacter faecitabidus TaxID=13243 RepID=A0A542ZXT9_RARFA|nr:hypothetical protein FB461_1549 [Rarobacter faecitabidus]
MSSKVTISQSKGARVVGLITIILGAVMIVAGIAAYWQVSEQLRAEKITVSQDASFLAGKRVAGPFTAYAQAEVINKHALEASDGKTYAELDKEDPTRATVMNASFLRASLFTSVVAFGVSTLVAGLGILFILVGWALRRITVGPAVTVETFDGAARHAAEVPAEVEDTPAADAETPPPTRAARRAAATEAAVEPGAVQAPVRRSGADVAETLSRRARNGDTSVTPVVAEPEPAREATPVISDSEIPPAASTPPPSFDSVVAEPVEPAEDPIPIPPSQSWQSPVNRAATADDIAGESLEDGSTGEEPKP